VFLLGNHYVSVYLVKGDRFSVLVEAGLSVTAPQILFQLEHLGIDPSSLKYLILTHTHADHLMGAPLIKKAFPGIRIAGVSDVRDLLSRKKMIDFFTREDAYTSKRLMDLKAVDAPAPQRPLPSFAVEKILSTEEILDLGGLTLHVLDAPGHCRGGIALWNPLEKTLFCSDYLGFRLASGRFVSNFYVDYNAYRRTFETLWTLKPRWLCPGHCGAFGGEDAVRFVSDSRREMDWISAFVSRRAQSPEELGEAEKILFDRYFIDEATIFSRKNTEDCMALLIRRILESKV
jgi:glyoxylase-like metal-dependent hydrolase (beta-lactamase superfamily II)